MKYTQYKIAVITNVSGQSMQDLKATAHNHGIIFDQITFRNIPLAGFAESELVQKICSYDVVYYRTGMRGPIIDELSHILRRKRIPFINGVAQHSYMHQKIRQALIAGRYNIPQPRSYYIGGFNYARVSEVLGDTFVVKPDDGSKGDDVTLVSSEAELLAFKETKKKDTYLYQELIEEAEEYRVYTLGSKGVASYKKTAGSEDFRANLHTGGTITPTEPELVEMLLTFGGKVAKSFGADISGVDILVKDNKPLFLELNWQPGWEKLDEAAGSNYCEETMQYILQKTHTHHSFLGKLTRLFS